MKKFFLFIALICVAHASAQIQDYSMMGFRPIVISESAPENVITYLEGKIGDALTNEGIALTSGDCVIEVTINELSKTLTPTAPPRTQLQLELTFKSIDKRQGVVFNSFTQAVSGMNTSDATAYMSAIRSFNFRTRNFMNFLDVSKEKLYAYYSAGYATQPEPAQPEPKAEPMPEPAPAPAPVAAPAPAPQGVELSSGVYVEYVKYEKKSSSTDIILQFVNRNSDDEKISLNWKEQLVIDSVGKNIKHNDVTYLDGSYMQGHAFTLIEGVPISIRITFKNEIDPVALYLHEGLRDKKVKINCK
ncbi:MAG: hypothetical protein SNI45_02415 [Rikenellaceae bacterium]